MKPDTQERPDFEKAAKEYIYSNDPQWSIENAFISGCEYADDLSRKRIEELEAALRDLVHHSVEFGGLHNDTQLKILKLLNHDHTRESNR